MATESMGPICDRPEEHHGTTDVAVIRRRAMLLTAAQDLAEGSEPPAVAGGLPHGSIRSAEKLLEPGEVLRVLGTDGGPLVQEALARQDEEVALID